MNFKHFFLSLGLGITLVGCGNNTSHTFMSYNVHNCIGLDSVTDFIRVGQIIKEVNPEVAAIQEVDSVTRRNNVFVIQEIAKTAGMFATFGHAIDFMGGKYGIGLLSKEKPLTHFNIPLPGREEKRTLLVVEFQDYLFCCVHLSLTEEDQVASVPLIKKTLAKYNKPVFLAGDFNAHPDSPTIQAMKKIGTILTKPSLLTYPTDKLDGCIDYIFQMNGTPSVEVVESGRVEVKATEVASDHKPVFAVVKF